MTAVKQPYQELFDYLSNELNCIATQTQMQDIEAIVIKKFEQKIKDAYNQGFKDGKKDYDFALAKEIAAKYSNAQNYYNKTFKK